MLLPFAECKYLVSVANETISNNRIERLMPLLRISAGSFAKAPVPIVARNSPIVLEVENRSSNKLINIVTSPSCWKHEVGIAIDRGGQSATR